MSDPITKADLARFKAALLGDLGELDVSLVKLKVDLVRGLWLRGLVLAVLITALLKLLP